MSRSFFPPGSIAIGPGVVDKHAQLVSIRSIVNVSEPRFARLKAAFALCPLLTTPSDTGSGLISSGKWRPAELAEFEGGGGMTWRQ